MKEEETKYIRSTDDAMDALKDMELTGDEQDRFQKAFKDPEFMKMFVDYAKEISEPSARAEQDAYLKQIENEGRTKEVYGENVELIMPNAGFVVKTTKIETKDKVFINICYSDKVKKATSTKAKGGTNWDVPYSLSAIRKEKDNKGVDCDTHDFVVASETYEQARDSQVFRKFIIQTSIENVEKQRYGKYEKQRSEEATLSREFKLPNIKFKGAESGPSVLAVKDRSGLKPGEENDEAETGGRVRPLETPRSFNGVDIPPAQDLTPPPPAPGPELQSQEELQEEPLREPTRSGFQFDFKKKKGAEVGEVKPEYSLVHRGQADLQEAWSGAADNRVKFQNTIPKALVVRVALPRLDSIAGVDLDVSARRILLVKPDMYRLDIELPFKVDDSKGKAKFDKTKKCLELVLPVVAPPAPKPQPFVELLAAHDQEQEAKEDAHDQPTSTLPHQMPESAVSVEVASAVADPTNRVFLGDDVCVGEASVAAWKEMMQLHDEKQRAAAAAQQGVEQQHPNEGEIEEGSQIPHFLDQEFYEATEFNGQRKGYVFKNAKHGIGYYKDVVEIRKYVEVNLQSAISNQSAQVTTPQAEKRLGYFKDSVELQKDGFGFDAKNENSEVPSQSHSNENESQTNEFEDGFSRPQVLTPRLFSGDVLELD